MMPVAMHTIGTVRINSNKDVALITKIVASITVRVRKTPNYWVNNNNNNNAMQVVWTV